MFAAIAALSCEMNCFAASDVTGKVNVVNINDSWGGVMIQLTGAPGFESGSPCAGPWAFIPNTSPLAKHYFAAAMLAKASGETVRVATDGCTSTSIGQIPKVIWIDSSIEEMPLIRRSSHSHER